MINANAKFLARKSIQNFEVKAAFARRNTVPTVNRNQTRIDKLEAEIALLTATIKRDNDVKSVDFNDVKPVDFNDEIIPVDVRVL